MAIIRVTFLYFLILLLTIPLRLPAQSKTYTVTRSNGKEIGTVKTTAKQSKGLLTYKVLSDVNFKVLWKEYHRQTHNEVSYQSASMQESLSCVYMNNDLEDSSHIGLAGKAYHCYRSPDIYFELKNEGKMFTTAKLYFEEPVGVEKIYSERFLENCRLEALGNHKYKLYLPSGKVNYYTYANKLLTEVLVERTWFDLKIRPK